MMFRDEKLKEAILHAAAEYVQLESNRTSLITITGIRLTDKGTKATILFTVLPTDKEETVLAFLKRNRSEFRKTVLERVRRGRIPFMDFEIDHGEHNRQKIDELTLEN